VSVALGVDKGVEENEFGNREEGPGERRGAWRASSLPL